MADEPDDIVLRQLRAIDAKLDRVLAESGELKVRMSGMEQHLLAIQIDISGLRSRLDHLEVRLDRIERRLGLVEA